MEGYFPLRSSQIKTAPLSIQRQLETQALYFSRVNYKQCGSIHTENRVINIVFINSS